jgi:hypothetical protein
MKFSIYGRFQLEVRREAGAWVAYRLGQGLRTSMPDVVIPDDLPASDLATYLDDLFHELAQPGESVVSIQ